MDTKTHKTLRPLQPPQRKQLYSLNELKEKNERENTAQTMLGFHAPYPKKKLSILARLGIWMAGLLLTLLLTIGSSLVYLTSPWGEEAFTGLVETTINYIGKPMDLRVSIASLGDLWKGRIHIVNLRIYDSYGPWIRISEGTLHPDWISLIRSIAASWRYTRDKQIPPHFFRNNAPIVSLSSIRNNTHHSNVKNLPFVMEHGGSSVQDIQDSHDAQNHESRKSLHALNNSENTQKKLVDNLLVAKDILNNKVVLGLYSGTLVNVVMPRFPKYTFEEKENSIDPQNLFNFLPPWLALDVGELEFADFQLGPDARSINFSTRLHGQMSSEKLLLRSTLLAAKSISSQWVLPAIQELPDDVMISLSKMDNFLQTDSRESTSKYRDLLQTRRILGYFTLDYDKGDIDLRWQIQDSLLIPLAFSGVDILWTRSRILAQIPTWPPTPEQPLQARFASRYGLRLVQDSQIIPTSSSSGQLFWDNNKIILRDIDVQSPATSPNLSIKASLGYSPHEGFGSHLMFSISELEPFVTVFGIDTKQFPVGGPLEIDSYVSRGGDLLFWWSKPLSPVQGQRSLPGYYANPHDGSILAKSVLRYIKNTYASAKNVEKAHEALLSATSPTKKSNNYDATHPPKKGLLANTSPFGKTEFGPLPIPSQGADGLIYSLKVESPQLRLPKGNIDNVFLSITGTSAHAPSTPEGQHFYTRHKKSTNSSLPLSDFTSQGIPRGLLGDVFLRFGDVFKQGTGVFTGGFFAGGAYKNSKAFQLRLHDINLDFPGISGDGNMAFAYALPIVKRRWPWVDGDLNIHIDNWDFIATLFESPVRTNNATLFSTYKSILNEQGKPVQTFRAKVDTQRVESKEFMVRQATAYAESSHVHSLADTLALSFAHSRAALARKMHYTPEDHIPTFMASLDIASGRGGPIRWAQGQGNMNVTGDKANFSVQMLGELSALLEGLFNFRTRTLSLKDMVIKSKK